MNEAEIKAIVDQFADVWAPTKRSRGRLRIGLGHEWSFHWCAVAARVRGGPGAPGKGKLASDPPNTNTLPSMS
jgi:hypothetical protein